MIQFNYIEKKLIVGYALNTNSTLPECGKRLLEKNISIYPMKDEQLREEQKKETRVFGHTLSLGKS
jgi:hypothetical protein